MIDLGAWATERYRVPITNIESTESSIEELSDDEVKPN